jgi:hypothetical protein
MEMVSSYPYIFVDIEKKIKLLEIFILTNNTH